MSWAAAHGLAALPNAVAFVLGFGTVFTVIGLTLTAAMAPLRDYLPLIRQLGGILLIILGLNLMGVLRFRRLAGSWRPLDRLVSFRPARAAPRHHGRTGPGCRVRGRLDTLYRTHAGRHPDHGGRGVRARRQPRCSSPTPWVWASPSCCWRWQPTGPRPSPAPCSATDIPSSSSAGGLVVVMGFAILFDWLARLLHHLLRVLAAGLAAR